MSHVKAFSLFELSMALPLALSSGPIPCESLEGGSSFADFLPPRSDLELDEYRVVD